MCALSVTINWLVFIHIDIDSMLSEVHKRMPGRRIGTTYTVSGNNLLAMSIYKKLRANEGNRKRETKH